MGNVFNLFCMLYLSVCLSVCLPAGLLFLVSLRGSSRCLIAKQLALYAIICYFINGTSAGHITDKSNRGCFQKTWMLVPVSDRFRVCSAHKCVQCTREECNRYLRHYIFSTQNKAKTYIFMVLLSISPTQNEEKNYIFCGE